MRIDRKSTVLVTGASGGIGLSLAKAFAARGALIICADRSSDIAETGAAAVVSAGGRAVGLELDVSDPRSWERACDDILERFGKVDLICNNAGITIGKSSIADVRLEDWDRIVSINLSGVFYGCRFFLDRLYGGGKAHIVNTASLCGLVTCAGSGAYIATKFAVLGLSEALKFDLRSSDVSVSVLCPGFVKTGLAKAADPHAGAEAASARTNRSAIDSGLEPEYVAEIVLRGVEANEFYLMTHPEYGEAVARRHRTIESALGKAERSDGNSDDIGILAGEWMGETFRV